MGDTQPQTTTQMEEDEEAWPTYETLFVEMLGMQPEHDTAELRARAAGALTMEMGFTEKKIYVNMEEPSDARPTRYGNMLEWTEDIHDQVVDAMLARGAEGEAMLQEGKGRIVGGERLGPPGEGVKWTILDTDGNRGEVAVYPMEHAAHMAKVRCIANYVEETGGDDERSTVPIAQGETRLVRGTIFKMLCRSGLGKLPRGKEQRATFLRAVQSSVMAQVEERTGMQLAEMRAPTFTATVAQPQAADAAHLQMVADREDAVLKLDYNAGGDPPARAHDKCTFDLPQGAKPGQQAGQTRPVEVCGRRRTGVSIQGHHACLHGIRPDHPRGVPCPREILKKAPRVEGATAGMIKMLWRAESERRDGSCGQRDEQCPMMEAQTLKRVTEEDAYSRPCDARGGCRQTLASCQARTWRLPSDLVQSVMDVATERLRQRKVEQARARAAWSTDITEAETKVTSGGAVSDGATTPADERRRLKHCHICGVAGTSKDGHGEWLCPEHGGEPIPRAKRTKRLFGEAGSTSAGGGSASSSAAAGAEAAVATAAEPAAEGLTGAALVAAADAAVAEAEAMEEEALRAGADLR